MTILSLKDVDNIVSDFDCQPFEYRVDCIQCVRADGLSPIVTGAYCEDVSHAWFIQAMLARPDSNTGKMGMGHGRKFLISPHATTDEVVRTCLLAALGYADHDLRKRVEADVWSEDLPSAPAGRLSHLAEDTVRRLLWS